jgi:hypothetical protein
MGQDECGAGDVTDLAGAGGDVLEGAPAAREQGEAAFALATQGPPIFPGRAILHLGDFERHGLSRIPSTATLQNVPQPTPDRIVLINSIYRSDDELFIN